MLIIQPFRQIIIIKHISIHLMLMLIYTSKDITCLCREISIHLMLMLIFSAVICKTIFKHISIHLMLMLILGITLKNITFLSNFNTSHVNVNHTNINKCKSIYIISIHLMLMLIVSFIRYSINSVYISIHLMLMLILIQTHMFITCFDFNTSHVNVNLYRPFCLD